MYSSESVAPSTTVDYFDWCSGIIGNPTSTNNGNSMNNLPICNINNSGNQNSNNTATADNGSLSSPSYQSATTGPNTPPSNSSSGSSNSGTTSPNTPTTSSTTLESLSNIPFYYQYIPNYGMVLTPVRGLNNSSILPPQAWAQPSPQVQQQINFGQLYQPLQIQLANSNNLNSSNSNNSNNSNSANVSVADHFQNFLKMNSQLQFQASAVQLSQPLNQNGVSPILQNQQIPQLPLPNIDINIKPSVDSGDSATCEQDYHLIKKFKLEPSDQNNQNNYIQNYNGGNNNNNQNSLILSDNSSPEQHSYSASTTLSPLTPPQNFKSENGPLALVISKANNSEQFSGHWETGIDPTTLKKQNEIMKMMFVKSNVSFFENYSDSGKHQACWNLTDPMHRNYYQAIQFRLPSQGMGLPITKVDENNGVVDLDKLGFINKLPCSYENYRIYIHPSLGYSGNAKRFKNKPDSNENALVFDGNVYDGHLNPIYSCKICTEYYQTKSYFSANPNAKGKVLLVKNNILTRVKDGCFSLSLKPMCCSGHNSQLPLYFHFTLTDPTNGKVVLQSLINVNVKQWKKSQPKQGSQKRKREESNLDDN